MIIEVDQSGKVEQTGKDTAIACTDEEGFERSIQISAKEKRKLQKFFRGIGKPRFYTHKVFALLVFILIRGHVLKLSRIIIDPEYPGYEKLLSSLIAELIKEVHPTFEADRILFKRVGKRSNAHIVANTVFRKEQKPTIVVTAQDLLKIIAK